MQLLIENAVKHNPPAKENKLRIDIVIGNGYVVVRNNIDAGANDGEGLKTTGIGLKNLQRQYELLASDKEIMINRSDDAFEVVMPIIYKYGKTKVLIIEDEPINAGRLKRQIADIDDTLTIDGPLTSVDEVKAKLKSENDYDLIFADIRLGNKLVFDAFQTVMPKCFVVFTTAYDEYALDAFKNNGIDYLLKPIDPDELRNAMKKVREAGPDSSEHERLGKPMVQIEAHYRRRLLVTKGDEFIPIRTDNISYIRKDENVRIYLQDGSSYSSQYSLNELEQMLDPEMFFRINRQYIAAINSFVKIRSFFNSKLTVRLKNCDDGNIVVSKDRASQFKDWLDR